MPIKSTDKAFNLRIDVETYERLAQNAKREKRSVNSEILLAIEKHLQSLVGEPKADRPA